MSAKIKNQSSRKSAGSTDSARSRNNLRKIILIDGHSLAFRAFFALPDTLITSSGQVTNAVYGFTSMLIKLLADERPQAVIVCFDKGAPQFRLDRYAAYKAGRAETPDLFRQQLPLIREVLRALRIPIVELEGYEADDLLATLTKNCRGEGCEVIVVTGDRDILQLVGEGVSVIMTRRGISDVIRYDAPTVIERYGVSPDQWLDFVALKGEPSDNLPGIPGVGDKTAAQLVKKYGDIEGIIAHADELTPKLRDSIKAHAEQVRINKELGRLLNDVGLELDSTKLCLERWDDEEVLKLFTSLEFRSLHERLRALNMHVSVPLGAALEPKSISELRSADEIKQDGPVALAWSENWLAVCDGPGEVHTLDMGAAMDRLGEFFQDPMRLKVAHDAKSIYRLALAAGIEFQSLYCDIKIAAYLLEPGSASGYTLADAAKRYLGVLLNGNAPELAIGEQSTLAFGAPEKERIAREAMAIRGMVPILQEQLSDQGIWELATTLEFPLIWRTCQNGA